MVKYTTEEIEKIRDDEIKKINEINEVGQQKRKICWLYAA
jgi:hypothetical protein